MHTYNLLDRMCLKFILFIYEKIVRPNASWIKVLSLYYSFVHHQHAAVIYDGFIVEVKLCSFNLWDFF